jgi:putative peptide zinc metalloprotease protein
VARLFDSQTPLEQVAAMASAQEEVPLAVDEVAGFAGLLDRWALLDHQLPPTAIMARQRAMTDERSSLFHLKLPLVRPDRFLGRLLVVLRPLFSVPSVVSMVVLIVAAMVVHAAWHAEMTPGLTAATHGSGLAWLYGVTATTLTTHELAHGLCSRRFGAEVREMGLLLLYGMPCAYTDITDAYLLPNKWQRIWITLAGPFSDLVVWAVATWLLVTVNPGPLGQKILGATILTTGFRSLLLNLNPLIKLDGYYVLTDLLEMPNLRQRSRRVVAWRLWSWLRRSVASPEESDDDRRVLEIYGWLSLLYVVALLSVTAILLDSWLVQWAGVYGRLAVWGIAVLVIVHRIWRARTPRQV